jgi:hypothetical protein
MIDHIILTVTNVERLLACYEAGLAPLDSNFFIPYEGKTGDRNSGIWRWK